MEKSQFIGPDHTAVRVALWRALHVLIDAKPHVFSDEIGAKIVGEPHWRKRPDMEAQFSKPMRASIVGRARFIEDLVEDQVNKGIDQYVILGAGLDTFAERRSDFKTHLNIFEIDQPGPQEWKKSRLSEIGYDCPSNLAFVPVNFEANESWWDKLLNSGFDKEKPAVVVSTGVSMYLTREANFKIFKQLAQLAPKSTFAMTFMLNLDLLDLKERSIMEFVMTKAKETGTPFLSLFTPEEMNSMAIRSGFCKARYVSADEIFNLYFAKREDGLRAGNVEAFLVANT